MATREGKPISFDARNWYVYTLYSRKEYDACLNAIEDQLKETGGLSAYPIFVKALIKRQRGAIQESLELFQAAACLKPHDPENLKQVGKSLHLLGKHAPAIEVYQEAQKILADKAEETEDDDWELWHNMGLCYMHLKDFKTSLECFDRANLIGRHDATFLELGNVYTQMEDLDAALDAYVDGLHFSPDNGELMTAAGLICLRKGEGHKAFEYLGNALSIDSKNVKAILAAGSILQDNEDHDVALAKYCLASTKAPNSPQLWNNIGMCFYGKQRYVTAIACLKRALYLDPFEWIVSYNLGLSNLCTGQHASAFHYFSSSIKLKSDYASSYMYLGITLNRLGDFENACGAFEKAIETNPNENIVYLNYAIILFRNAKRNRARDYMKKFEALYEGVDFETKIADTETRNAFRELKEALTGVAEPGVSSGVV